MFYEMGGASSQSLLCCRLSAQHDVILTRAKETHVAGSWISRNKYKTAKMFCKIFTAAKTF